MSTISTVTVQNIRSHESFSLTLSPTVTVITGSNGSGKTSLLEAIYIALQGTSFKGNDTDVLRHEQEWWRIDLHYDDQTKRTVKFEPSKDLKRKQFLVEEKPIYRLTPRYRYPVVLFEPDDLRLLHGSPTRRRQFIDHFISQLDPAYVSALHSYDRALKQRNNLLKQARVVTDELFVWDVALSEYGAYIIEQRIRFIEQLNSKLNEAYNEIAQSPDYISVHYSYTAIGTVKQKLLAELHTHHERDKLLGFTSTGPHRHDVVFEYNNLPALTVASRGEVRSIVLALKFLEVEIIESITGDKPIILLDDVFSELDEARQERLLRGDNQIIITTTHLMSNSEKYREVKL